MTSTRNHLLATVLAVLGATAMAQTPPAGAAGQGPMMGQGDHAQMHQQMHGQMMQRMQERRTQRLAEFKQRLQITPAQEGAWNAFVASMQPPAQPPQRPDRAEMERLTTPERIDRMRALRAQRNAEMDRRAEAAKTFYATLNPEQKKTFDQASMKLLGGGRGHGHGHGMHHG